MKKVLVTSDRFTGQAEITYDANGKFLVLDVTDTNMPPEQLTLFKRAVPVLYDNLAEALPTCTIVPADVVVTFDMFWKQYPLHRNRYKAENFWITMSKTDQVAAFVSLKSYNELISKVDWHNAMIADKYLRNKEFETDWKEVLKKSR